MKRIDSHQHFWKYHPVKDRWISDDMEVIKRDFMPIDLRPILQGCGVKGCVAVQADQALEETAFLLELASEFEFIYGVVGWIDLQRSELEKQLDHFANEKKLKGFRHIVQAENDSQFLLRPAFLSGMNLLKDRSYTYDLLISADQLSQAVLFAERIDKQPVVIDHMAKPPIKNREFDVWAKEMEKLATFENFYCKISGLVTEANWVSWKIEEFEPYINHILSCFGSDRVMYGSDWPVCTLAADYNQTLEILDTYIKHLSIKDQEKIWSKNAERFYGL